MAEKAQKKDEKLSTVDKLRMLLDITKTISRSLDLEEVLNLVMDTLGSLIHYDAAGIYLVEFSPEDKSPYIFRSKVIRGYKISFELIEPRLDVTAQWVDRELRETRSNLAFTPQARSADATAGGQRA